MPIWLELMVLSFLAYAVGFMVGWLIWGRTTEKKGE